MQNPDAPPRTLVAPLLGLAATSAGALLLLGSIVSSGESPAFDRWWFETLLGLRREVPTFAEAMRDISALGSLWVLAPAVTLAALLLWLDGRRASALTLLGSLAAARLTIEALKFAFARARPDAALAHYEAHGYAFPSAHAGMSAVVFLTLGALVARVVDDRRRRAVVLGAALLLAFAVGASRVVLGVHWATDVLGGWAFGAAWAAASLAAARRAGR
jgi:undecaprenyl-diphosphatase